MVQMFDSATDKIFRKSGKDRSAADTYCKTLRKLIEGVSSRVEKVLEFCREGHFHPHGTRKGAAMMVTTGTMEPPSMPSVLLRGEWSLGKVLDIYWRWSKLGDTYLGRLLAGLDPDNEEQFATLPPHFIQGMENEYIREGMMLRVVVVSVYQWQFTTSFQLYPGTSTAGATPQIKTTCHSRACGYN